jgi:hypothetical protein
MATRSRTVLKTYFETGDYPTEAQFGDLIDSMTNTTDDGTPITSVVTDSSLDGAGTSGSPLAIPSADVTSYKTEAIIVACSDETTALTTGTAKATFRMPFAMTLTAVRASLTGAGSTSGTTTVDINESGTTVLSTKLTIDYGELTSTTAATAAVISDSSLADDAEITIDIDAITGGADETGLKVTLIGNR